MLILALSEIVYRRREYAAILFLLIVSTLTMQLSLCFSADMVKRVEDSLKKTEVRSFPSWSRGADYHLVSAAAPSVAVADGSRRGSMLADASAAAAYASALPGVAAAVPILSAELRLLNVEAGKALGGILLTGSPAVPGNPLLVSRGIDPRGLEAGGIALPAPVASALRLSIGDSATLYGVSPDGLAFANEAIVRVIYTKGLVLTSADTILASLPETRRMLDLEGGDLADSVALFAGGAFKPERARAELASRGLALRKSHASKPYYQGMLAAAIVAITALICAVVLFGASSAVNSHMMKYRAEFAAGAAMGSSTAQALAISALRAAFLGLAAALASTVLAIVAAALSRRFEIGAKGEFLDALLGGGNAGISAAALPLTAGALSVIVANMLVSAWPSLRAAGRDEAARMKGVKLL